MPLSCQQDLEENRDGWPKAKLLSSTPSSTSCALHYVLGLFFFFLMHIIFNVTGKLKRKKRECISVLDGSQIFLAGLN